MPPADESPSVWRPAVFAARAVRAAAATPALLKPTGKPTAPVNSVKVRKSGLSYKEQKELDALPQQITDLENEQAELARQLAEPEVYADHLQAAQLSRRSTEIDVALLNLLARWEELESKREESTSG